MRLLAGALLSCCYLSAEAAVSKALLTNIQCDVCKLAVKEARGHAKNNSMQDEDELKDLIENVCDPKSPNGKWITKVDITRRVNQFALDVRETRGECRNECKAVKQACSKALNGKEDDMTSLLQKVEGLSKFYNQICDKACSKKPAEVVDWKDEEWKEDSTEAIRSLTDSMKGMPGMENMQMYGRDDIEKLTENMKMQEEMEKMKKDQEKEEDL